CARDGYTFDYW
nr:immunoglobulin heavy chain junction region [Mus musculus]MBK4198374.1 immunoglobulin heavy chain junction region [Mus musculus]MBK4198375.1 immunoglobulin heavy chain junction region [Mus musculus]MBK4198376.1 immunoglobulin heavy chain junction region [Mus musculus]